MEGSNSQRLFRALVLTFIQQEGRLYGLALLQRLSEYHDDMREGTLYPLLNRMRREGLLVSAWQVDTEQSHPRKYYSLTEEGGATLDRMRQHFAEMHAMITIQTEGGFMTHEKLNTYLDQLFVLLQPMPVSERAEVILEIKSHVLDMMQAHPMKSEEEVLEELGSPESVARQYRQGDAYSRVAPNVTIIPAKKSYSPVAMILLGLLGLCASPFLIALMASFFGFLVAAPWLLLALVIKYGFVIGCIAVGLMLLNRQKAL